MSSEDETTDVQLDISKYEEHTPGPWHIVESDSGTGYGDGTYYLGLSGDVFITELSFRSNEHESHPDVQLMADAPLLLEEVKTLQRKLMLAESALGEIRAYHEIGQGNLGEIIEHYQENEQVEMPNAFDEDDA